MTARSTKLDAANAAAEQIGGHYSPIESERCSSALRSVEAATQGLQAELPEVVGRGYRDTFRFSEHLLVTVCDATYASDQWIAMQGNRFFNIRILLSGEIKSPTQSLLLSGAGAMIDVVSGDRPSGVFISGKLAYQSVTLQCRLELLTKVLGLSVADIPSPLNQLTQSENPITSSKIRCAPECRRVAGEILESRHAMPKEFRIQYIEYAAMSILCGVLSALADKSRLIGTGSTLRARDLDRVFASRDYLADNFAAPPTIPALAKRAGINQTKLKAGFREVTGKTIYDFILERRMARASELLLAGDRSVAEIAYAVGYQYPANFTCAYKKHFGHLPRSLRAGGPHAIRPQ